MANSKEIRKRGFKFLSKENLQNYGCFDKATPLSPSHYVILMTYVMGACALCIHSTVKHVTLVSGGGGRGQLFYF